MTGGRLMQVGKYLNSGRAVLHDLWRRVGKYRYPREIAFTWITAARPRWPAFGRRRASAGSRREGTKVISFEEKPHEEGGLINGGFFVLDPSVLELIDGHDTVWEKEPMESLAADGQLAAWVHRGFWQPMDTLRDKQQSQRAMGQRRAALEAVEG
jgi:glucose-1-phosphate cytidylyltransferase